MAINLLMDGMDSAPPDAGGAELTPLQIVMRSKWRILGFAVVATALAGIGIARIPPTYTATSSVIVDARRIQFTQAENLFAAPLLDNVQLRTYMEELTSPAIALAVADKLRLGTNPEYCRAARDASAPSHWQALSNAAAALGATAGPDASADLAGRIRLAWQNLATSAPVRCPISPDEASQLELSNVSGSNDGRSYVIRITAAAHNPELAAALANAHAEAYADAQRQQATEAARQADGWINSYLNQLNVDVQAADAQVNEFRRRTQLTPVRGETFIGQRLAELNTQLTQATADLAQKQATLQQVQSLRGNVAAAAPVLGSTVIQQLLIRRSELQATEADLRSRLGDSHPAVQAAAAQARRADLSLLSETTKAVSSLGGDVAALATRRKALADSVLQLEKNVTDQGGDSLRLADLQRNADTYHRLYETMMVRRGEIAAQRNMQWDNTRVALLARPPLAPVFPRLKMMLVGTFIAMLGVGSGLAFLQRLLARGFATIEQVEQLAGARVLGLFARPNRRSSPHDAVLDSPFSREAESLHSVLINLLGGRSREQALQGRVVMLTSALPKEGKSSLSIALGRSAAKSGLLVAVLDFDMRKPSLRSLMEPGGRSMPAGATGFGAAEVPGVTVDQRSRMHLVTLQTELPDVRHLLNSPSMAPALEALRRRYDLILVDTPPVLAVPDAVNLAPLVDDVVLVTDWQGTSKRAVAAAIRVLRRGHASISGVVLSKVNLRQFARQPGGEGFYAASYPGYGRAATGMLLR